MEPATPDASRTRMGTRAWAIPIAVSFVVLIAGRFAVASVHDAATLQGVPDVYLGRPDAYVDFAPFSDVLDSITLLSERQHVAVLLGLVVVWSLCRFARGGRTLLRIKGWRRLDRDELAVQIERALRVGGFGATHVVERTTADPETSAAALALSVLVVPWRMLTPLSAGERWMWLAWTWAIAGVELQLRRRRMPRRGIAASPAP